MGRKTTLASGRLLLSSPCSGRAGLGTVRGWVAQGPTDCGRSVERSCLCDNRLNPRKCGSRNPSFGYYGVFIRRRRRSYAARPLAPPAMPKPYNKEFGVQGCVHDFHRTRTTAQRGRFMRLRLGLAPKSIGSSEEIETEGIPGVDCGRAEWLVGGGGHPWLSPNDRPSSGIESAPGLDTSHCQFPRLSRNDSDSAEPTSNLGVGERHSPGSWRWQPLPLFSSCGATDTP